MMRRLVTVTATIEFVYDLDDLDDMVGSKQEAIDDVEAYLDSGDALASQFTITAATEVQS